MYRLADERDLRHFIAMTQPRVETITVIFNIDTIARRTRYFLDFDWQILATWAALDFPDRRVQLYVECADYDPDVVAPEELWTEAMRQAVRHPFLSDHQVTFHGTLDSVRDVFEGTAY